jgi:hypothetical protein
MNTERKAVRNKVASARRRHRARPIPRWLQSSQQLDAIARSRCLLLLSVLSGETPVTEAIARAKLSRGTYYKLETRALQAMLAAMNPLAGQAEDGRADLSLASARIGELEGKVKLLERDKRRSERLLLLTRKSLKAPVVTAHRGRWPRRLLASSSTPTSPGASSH